MLTAFQLLNNAAQSGMLNPYGSIFHRLHTEWILGWDNQQFALHNWFHAQHRCVSQMEPFKECNTQCDMMCCVNQAHLRH